MGFIEASYYVYNMGSPLGIRTNLLPDGLPSTVGRFLDSCPVGVQIGFDLTQDDQVIVRVAASLDYKESFT